MLLEPGCPARQYRRLAVPGNDDSSSSATSVRLASAARGYLQPSVPAHPIIRGLSTCPSSRHTQSQPQLPLSAACWLLLWRRLLLLRPLLLGSCRPALRLLRLCLRVLLRCQRLPLVLLKKGERLVGYHLLQQGIQRHLCGTERQEGRQVGDALETLLHNRCTLQANKTCREAREVHGADGHVVTDNSAPLHAGPASQQPSPPACRHPLSAAAPDRPIKGWPRRAPPPT